jgi:MYXO-CTERM domain-containing protein
MQGLPPGVTGNLSPIDSAHSSTLTLHAAPDASLGSYPASIVATGGGVTRTVPLSVEVVAGSSGGCSTGGGGSDPVLLALLLLGGSCYLRRSRRAAAH